MVHSLPESSIRQQALLQNLRSLLRHTSFQRQGCVLVEVAPVETGQHRIRCQVLSLVCAARCVLLVVRVVRVLPLQAAQSWLYD